MIYNTFNFPTVEDELEAAGVFTASGGAARLLRRDELPTDWRPETDAHLTHWECAQHLARVLNAQDGGTMAAARLMAGMGTDDASAARGLAYRLYDICERKSRADEAQVWNMLAREWPAIEAEVQLYEADRSEGTLARISHQVTAADADLTEFAALNAARVLDVLSSTPARPDSRSPCKFSHLHALARNLVRNAG